MLSSAILLPIVLPCASRVCRCDQCSDKEQGQGQSVRWACWLTLALPACCNSTQRFCACARAGFLVPSSPPLVPLVVAEPPSYYSRLSSYTQTLSADTLVYLALRVTGRFICVKTYQFAEINGNIRLPASAPCYARSTVLLPSKPPALLLRLSILQAGRPRVPASPPAPVAPVALLSNRSLRWLLGFL